MHLRHLIDGQDADSADGRTFDDVTPIDNSVIGTVALGGPTEVDQAVQAARGAFESWSRTPVTERRVLLERVADQIDARRDELAECDTRDMGAPISDTRGVLVPKSAEVMRFFAEWAEHVNSAAYHRRDIGVLSYTAHEPLGVVAAIAPWNQPLLAMAWKLAPALAFGCTVVMKPAEESPTTATILAEICRDAGIPDGVVNLVHGFGPDSAGEALVTHPGVDGVAFTGASDTGKALMAKGAPTLKRLSLELGGKSANIVCDDADLDLAVPGSASAVLNNQGQICVAGSRALVHRSVYEEFLERFVTEARSWTIGDPRDPATRLGPLVSAAHLDRVAGYVDLAEREGASVLFGGGRPAGPDLAAGNYVEPTVLTGVDNTMRCVREEIFGPVLAVMPFDDLDEAIRIANDTSYGLAGMVWTRSLERAHRVTNELRTGNIWVNTFAVRDRRAPFGGFKESGIGREGGDHSMEFYTEQKAVYIRA